MSTREQCERFVGKWVHFRTKYGYHMGLVERVTPDSAIILSPRQLIPVELASTAVSTDEVQKLDAALAWWGGFGRGGFPGPGYGAPVPRFSPRFGPPRGGFGGYGVPGGYGGLGGFGWGRWAVSFLVIYLLWGLLWW